MSDAVNHPNHYNVGNIEVIDAIEAWGLNFSRGNAVKYIARADHKGRPVEDLKKAAWYIQREIERLEKEESDIKGGAEFPNGIVCCQHEELGVFVCDCGIYCFDSPEATICDICYHSPKATHEEPCKFCIHCDGECELFDLNVDKYYIVECDV